MVETCYLDVRSKGHLDVIDITEGVASAVRASGIDSGIAVVFVGGSTGAITTIEFEPGLKKDLKDSLEKMFPYGADYAHHQTWGDDNGSGHLQSAFLKTSFTAPFVGGKMLLGTWQQIVFVECDTRGRDRRIVVQLVG